ncbi:hypothetical protein [Desulfotruncus alcoholivorax]|uniref:hypothetical protein n=1 Tax=Desulfotruncus alcoholivorax TaxID=265477 RepID=UPI000487D51A|nr:hypothetical protein [Desulfotruncus alcoholivorax]
MPPDQGRTWRYLLPVLVILLLTAPVPALIRPANACVFPTRLRSPAANTWLRPGTRAAAAAPWHV